MKSHLVSIIVPCFNQANYINDCLQSIMNQTYDNWECVIVNDGSPDDTEEIAQDWVNKDSRYKLINKKNGGLSSARNAGLKNINGDWVLFLDCDDKISKDKLLNASRYFDDYDVIISNYQLFEKDKLINQYCDYLNEKLSYKSLVLNWDTKFSIPIHSAIFKNVNLPTFNEELKAKEDWLFWLSVFKDDITYIIYSDLDSYYRVHSEGMTKNHEFMLQNEELAYYYIYDQLTEELKRDFFKNRLAYKNDVILNQLNRIKELDSKLNSKTSLMYKILRNLYYKIKNL